MIDGFMSVVFDVVLGSDCGCCAGASEIVTLCSGSGAAGSGLRLVNIGRMPFDY
jgi:hypothetical protein